jgi:DNA-binding CsgD family transcriptional regulator
MKDMIRGGPPSENVVNDPFGHIASIIEEGVLEPDFWPPVLEALTEVLGGAGAAVILRNKTSGQVERVRFWGSSPGVAGLQADYLNYYSALDPYGPLVHAGPSGSSKLLSETVPAATLRNSEWYNDFVLKCGVRDIFGTVLFSSPSQTAMIGIHYPLYRSPSPRHLLRLKELVGPLGRSAHLRAELRNLGWKSSVAVRALDQLASGIVVTDGDARVVELNRAAGSLLECADGLAVRGGRLCAGRAFENAKLTQFIAAAAAEQSTPGAVRRMMIGRCGDRLPLAVAVMPLGAGVALFDCPLALIMIVAPDEQLPLAGDLADLFGLSPAESRLAAALVEGKRLAEIAREAGVRITTLRTQLSSILRKVGVAQQTDLIRVLSRLPVLPTGVINPTVDRGN